LFTVAVNAPFSIGENKIKQILAMSTSEEKSEVLSCEHELR